METIQDFNKSVHRLLAAAHKLIDTPEKWTQGQHARNAKGLPVSPHDHGATCFCSLGALTFVTIHSRYSHRTDAIERAAMDILIEFMGMPIIEFNDNRSHAAVMEAWQEAIAYAKEQDNEPSISRT